MLNTTKIINETNMRTLRNYNIMETKWLGMNLNKKRVETEKSEMREIWLVRYMNRLEEEN